MPPQTPCTDRYLPASGTLQNICSGTKAPTRSPGGISARNGCLSSARAFRFATSNALSICSSCSDRVDRSCFYIKQTVLFDRYFLQVFLYCALIPFELRHIGQPFFIGFFRRELTVRQVFGKILRVLCPSGTAMAVVLYSGPDIPGSANTQHSLAVDTDIIVMTQIVIPLPVAFVRALGNAFLNLIAQMFVFRNSSAQFSRSPFTVSRTSRMKQFAGRLNKNALLFMTFFHRYVNMVLSYF